MSKERNCANCGNWIVVSSEMLSANEVGAGRCSVHDMDTAPSGYCSDHKHPTKGAVRAPKAAFRKTYVAGDPCPVCATPLVLSPAKTDWRGNHFPPTALCPTCKTHRHYEGSAPWQVKP